MNKIIRMGGFQMVVRRVLKAHIRIIINPQLLAKVKSSYDITKFFNDLRIKSVQ